MTICIGNQEIETRAEKVPIHDLIFFKDNPRIYTIVHGEPDFENKTDEEKQKIIEEKLSQEPSVKNLKPRVEKNGGLTTPILVRWDKKEVIEGNSRLAVYRELYRQHKEDKWEFINCHIVDKLTEKQQAIFLHEIHVRGKTKWSSYEKANFYYVREKAGWSVPEISKSFSESDLTVRKRIKVIKVMKQNKDEERSHFSYYEVLINNSELRKSIVDSEDKNLRNKVLGDIKEFGSGDEKNNKYTAKDLRDKLPAVMKKIKVYKKFISGELELEDAFQQVRISDVEKKIRMVVETLNGIELQDISCLEKKDFDKLKHSARRLKQQTERIHGMIEKYDEEIKK